MTWHPGLDPEYAGQCAFALSLGKKGVAGKQGCFVIEHGKKYLFSSYVAKLLWMVFPGFKDKADAHWNGK